VREVQEVTRERDIERQLIRRVKQAGGEVRKVMWIGRRGAPDRLVLIPDREPLFVELKAPGGRVSRLQEVEHRRLRAAGCKVMVIWKVEEIEGVVA
jgi:hypothetical protein